MTRSGFTKKGPVPARCGPRATPAPRDHFRAIPTGSDLELLENRCDRDDVSLELELGLLEPGGHTDQLREWEDRHVEVAAGPLAELRLPGVEREAEGAGRDHRVGAGLVACSDRLQELAEGGLLLTWMMGTRST